MGPHGWELQVVKPRDVWRVANVGQRKCVAGQPLARSQSLIHAREQRVKAEDRISKEWRLDALENRRPRSGAFGSTSSPAELAAPGTDAEERLFALKFLLHFVGDLHQPLHSSDNQDQGGNQVKVTAVGIKHKSKDELHGYWDTQFVDGINPSPKTLFRCR
jgi:hypothetical protein